ncbi:DUF1444 domain-containing protein [Fredinandcohnia quinoae]|uniref:UPF0354 protein MJG50_08430 n=1 Tax=Fredinandcohnia quinoae TaxID=2918902 RepID=A0AAW5E1A3_9BACI|nr:DUF1444 domain-containing protein [Fredinandcohnia sp. SECRCQ15]MCH1625349.1 DUF1444 domain-containing protein [Fredinandcohnia sp. SECRCQ15]
MDSKKLKKIIEDKLSRSDWQFTFDREKDTLRVEDKSTKKGITILLPGIVAKYEAEGSKSVDEVIYYIEESLTVMNKPQELSGKEKNIFPVIRSTSFPTEASDGKKLLYDEHTAETRIYYALDLGTTYRLIDEGLLDKEKWQPDQIREIAKFNIRSLNISYKEDTVAGNIFYFINTNDGYDASRILNESFLQKMNQKITGAMTVAVPHQDVLIIADIQNETGYDILAQMTMSFFTSGRVPITALSFLYEDNELEPIFILGKNRSRE